jgi:hypothetical protein
MIKPYNVHHDRHFVQSNVTAVSALTAISKTATGYEILRTRNHTTRNVKVEVKQSH